MSSQSPEGANGETKKPKGEIECNYILIKNCDVYCIKKYRLFIDFSDTPFSQQKLPAWQPVLTAGTVLPAFFVIGIAFVAIGVGLLYFTNGIKEKELDYTNCKNIDNASEICADKIQNNWPPSSTCKCEVPFELEEDWESPVYLYYGLTNFYQNHRRYVKSRDEKQLLGQISTTPSDVSSDCAPYDKTENEKVTVPCGAIANSLFNGMKNILKAL